MNTEKIKNSESYKKAMEMLDGFEANPTHTEAAKAIKALMVKIAEYPHYGLSLDENIKEAGIWISECGKFVGAPSGGRAGYIFKSMSEHPYLYKDFGCRIDRNVGTIVKI